MIFHIKTVKVKHNLCDKNTKYLK